MWPVRRPRISPPPARRVLSLLAAGAACAAGPGALRAQATPAASAVTGAVRDSATGRPLGGAVVLLRDSLDRTVRQGVTDERGRYRLAGTAEARRVRVLRIGFRPSEVPLPAAGAPGDVALAPVPVLLAPVRVAAVAARCPGGANSAAALGLLEQVRAGLLATVIARTEQPAELTVLVYERRFDPEAAGSDAAGEGVGADGAGRLVLQQVQRRTATAAAAPFGASRAGAEFVADGFREGAGAGARFFAPDAETLVDDDFAAGYCFRVAAADAARPHQVGLAFAAPRRRAGRVDVDGVLWVDTVARAVHDLSFRYVGLESTVEGLRPGGRVAFQQMPTGVAFVDRWALRLVSSAPGAGRRAFGQNVPYAGSGDGVGGPRLVVQEIGGELARVVWPDGRAWRAPLGTVRLRLVDRRGRPAAGALARLDETDYETTADAAGVVAWTDVLPGPYTASAVDPLLADRGRARPATRRVVAVRDSAVEARLTVEMAERVVAAQPPTAGIPAAGIPALGGPATRPGDTSSVAIGGGKSIERLFAGRFPGVDVYQAPGGGLSIRIRGGAGSFMSGEEPLYVVDGTPLPAGTGGIVHLNPYDIEQIEVLKNPADVGIYGLRGGNGVVRITTIRPGRR